MMLAVCEGVLPLLGVTLAVLLSVDVVVGVEDAEAVTVCVWDDVPFWLDERDCVSVWLCV